MTQPAPDRPPESLVRRHGSARAARAARARLARRLGPVLEGLLSSRDPAERLGADPVAFVHAYADPADREVVGLVASSLAYGNVGAIRASVGRVLSALGPAPSAAARSGPPKLEGFVHRWTRGPDVAALLFAAGRAQDAHGSLGACFQGAFEASGGEMGPALRAFAATLAAADFRPLHGRRAPPEGLAHLLPTGPGALKRLNMYLRWMVRGPDAVDLGLWPLPTSALIMPLDTHTGRLCRYLGLTDRKDASARTAEEVTWNLRGIDPEDPVRFDFALAHLGIAGDCAHRRHPVTCAACDLVRVCRL